MAESAELKLTILTPERRLLEQKVVEEVTLPGSEGQIQVLAGHAAMIGTLETGIFSYRISGKEPIYGTVSTGFFKIHGNEVHVMAETLELQPEIDVNRARKAQQNAEEALKGTDLDESQFKKYQLKLQRAIIRQQLASH